MGMPDEEEFLSEEEEVAWYEKRLQEVAQGECSRIIKRMALGYRPDVVDRILLRMARRKGVGTQSAKR